MVGGKDTILGSGIEGGLISQVKIEGQGSYVGRYFIYVLKDNKVISWQWATDIRVVLVIIEEQLKRGNCIQVEYKEGVGAY